MPCNVGQGGHGGRQADEDGDRRLLVFFSEGFFLLRRNEGANEDFGNILRCKTSRFLR